MHVAENENKRHGCAYKQADVLYESDELLSDFSWKTWIKFSDTRHTEYRTFFQKQLNSGVNPCKCSSDGLRLFFLNSLKIVFWSDHANLNSNGLLLETWTRLLEAGFTFLSPKKARISFLRHFLPFLLTTKLAFPKCENCNKQEIWRVCSFRG